MLFIGSKNIKLAKLEEFLMIGLIKHHEIAGTILSLASMVEE